jgi:hypothetical protein
VTIAARQALNNLDNATVNMAVSKAVKLRLFNRGQRHIIGVRAKSIAAGTASCAA